jgi:S-adenosyl-L-methionine hydrolase (adenosine-forming)
VTVYNQFKQAYVSIITITTDFGTEDGFAAQMKGTILCVNPSATIVDVTHSVRPFSVLHGALVLLGLVDYFPQGTVHLAVVDPGVGGNRKGLAIRTGNQFLVGPDNGIFSLIIGESHNVDVREITNESIMTPHPHPTFHGRDIFAPVAAHLSLGLELDEVGPQIDNFELLFIPPVGCDERGISGQVLYQDHFGNLATNIRRELCKKIPDRVIVDSRYVIQMGRTFSDVPQGSPLALINSFGFLEIAVNGASAAEILKVTEGAPVNIVYAR